MVPPWSLSPCWEGWSQTRFFCELGKCSGAVNVCMHVQHVILCIWTQDTQMNTNCISLSLSLSDISTYIFLCCGWSRILHGRPTLLRCIWFTLILSYGGSLACPSALFFPTYRYNWKVLNRKSKEVKFPKLSNWSLLYFSWIYSHGMCRYILILLISLPLSVPFFPSGAAPQISRGLPQRLNSERPRPNS